MTEPVAELLELQARVLEKVAVGTPFLECLNELCSLVEGMVPDSICSVMLLEDGVLNVAAAPRVGPELIAALNGLVPCDLAGSCGTAVFEKHSVFVTDTSCDPRWASLRGVATEYGIKACWSVPIFARDHSVLGSFAISHSVCREPSPFHETLLRTSSHLAGIAIERHAQAETRRRVEEAVRQSQKLESLGVLASGIAHDFNNILVGILGNAYLAREDLPESSPARKAIQAITESSRMASELTKQLLAYAGRGKLTTESLDLSTVGREMIDLVQSATQVKVETTQPPEGPWIQGDATQIRQVLLNLLTNAAEATQGSGDPVQLRTGVQQISGEEAKAWFFPPDLPAGPASYVEVRDSGIGMDEATLAKIFDPFFTTKTRGRGLGLAATLGIVKSHGGALVAESTPGRGTVFRLYFPSAEGAAVEAEELPAETQDTNHRTILIVDDEKNVLEVQEKMLERAGFSVLRALSGAKALEFVADSSTAVDAVVLDMTMPGLSGAETMTHLREERENLPVLLCSGQDPAEFQRLLELPQTSFLAKPFSPRELRSAVRDLVCESAPARN